MPGLPPALRDSTSPEFGVALAFATGHVLHAPKKLDVEPDRVAADGEKTACVAL